MGLVAFTLATSQNTFAAIVDLRQKILIISCDPSPIPSAHRRFCFDVSERAETGSELIDDEIAAIKIDAGEATTMESAGFRVTSCGTSCPAVSFPYHYQRSPPSKR